jgi:hypothetical protein
MVNNDKAPGPLITRQEAARRVGVTVRTVDYWRRTEKITTYKDRRGRVMVDADEIDDVMEPRPAGPGGGLKPPPGSRCAACP